MNNGTEKQIRWSEIIKNEKVIEIKNLIPKMQFKPEMEALFYKSFNVLKSCNNARFWIDMRDVAGMKLVENIALGKKFHGEYVWQAENNEIVAK